MGKNNPLRSMTPKNKNYKLYKAKKQWISLNSGELVYISIK